MQSLTHTVTPAHSGQTNTITCLPAGGPVGRERSRINNKKVERMENKGRGRRKKPSMRALQAGGRGTRETLDSTNITLVTARNLHSLPTRKHKQKIIEAIISKTCVSFLPGEGQPAEKNLRIFLFVLYLIHTMLQLTGHFIKTAGLNSTVQVNSVAARRGLC